MSPSNREATIEAWAARYSEEQIEEAIVFASETARFGKRVSQELVAREIRLRRDELEKAVDLLVRVQEMAVVARARVIEACDVFEGMLP